MTDAGKDEYDLAEFAAYDEEEDVAAADAAPEATEKKESEK